VQFETKTKNLPYSQKKIPKKFLKTFKKKKICSIVLPIYLTQARSQFGVCLQKFGRKRGRYQQQ
jgi:hypothetical protein